VRAIGDPIVVSAFATVRTVENLRIEPLPSRDHSHEFLETIDSAG
jgi:hypothetical protein